MQRRTTDQEKSHTKYANDCYALQQFIENNDPKMLNDTLKKTQTQLSKMSTCTTDTAQMHMQTEIASLQSKHTIMQQTIVEMKQMRLKDLGLTTQLSLELIEMKQYCRNLAEASNRTTTYHVNIIQTLKTEMATL